MIALAGLFNFIPSWIYAAVIAALVATNCTTSVRLQSEKLAHQTAKTEYAEQVAKAEKSRADEEAKRRKAETELSNAENTHAQEVAAIRADLDSVRSDSRSVAVRLRDKASADAERAGKVCADSTSAELRKAAATTARVLAELRQEADDYAGVVAQFATDAHLAGLACQRRYEEAREATK